MADYMVGRKPDPTRPRIVVSGDNHETVSSNHCWLSSLGQGLYKLDDNASTNGIFVREQGGWRRVSSVKVRANDDIMLGKHVTTVSRLLANAIDTKENVKLRRNPKTGEIERR